MFSFFCNCIFITFLSGCFNQTFAQPLELKVPLAHTNKITCIAFSPDGKYVLSGSEDNNIRLWEVATGREIRTFAGHSDDIIKAVFSPDGKQIISVSEDYSIKGWDIFSGGVLYSITGDFHEAVSFSPDRQYILSAKHKRATFWDVPAGKKIKCSGPTDTLHLPGVKKLHLIKDCWGQGFSDTWSIFDV
jgi:WD40 repeat protein